METGSVLLDLFILFVVAKVAAELFEHFHQPAVVGELLAGLVVGPHVLGFVGTDQVLDVVAELGVIILLFTVGLETSVSDLRRVGRSATMVALLGVALPFSIGVGAMVALGYEDQEALFVAAAMVATSVGVTARVLRDLRAVRLTSSRVVLGAAVVDDILAILILAVVAGLATGDLSSFELALVFGEISVFLGVAIVAGPRLVQRIARIGQNVPWIPRSAFTIAVGLTLGLAALSESIGLAAIIGAFLAGLIFDFRKEEVANQVQPVSEFLVPFFFAVTGSRLDPAVFADPQILWLAALITVLAALTKFVGGYAGSRSLGRATALAVGVGMVPRGEVGLIVASLGLGLGVISRDLFGVVVAMAVVTTLATPPVLAVFVKREKEEARRQRSG
ncbi:MAG: cation:proton antiporter [Actinomycetota bacterium]